MTTYSQPNDAVETYEQPAEQTQVGLPPPPLPSYPSYAPASEGGKDDGFSVARQRERYGGVNWGAGFFGWLVTAVMAVLMSALAVAGATALGVLGQVQAAVASSEPGTVGIAAAAVGFGVLVVAYYTGGYVAGRMSRFDGGKQGIGVWVTGLLLVGATAGVGFLFGLQSDAIDQLNLEATSAPTWAGGVPGLVAVAVALVGSLLAAVAGSKVGCRYHRKVDDAGYL
jgi:hypothetical protein